MPRDNPDISGFHTADTAPISPKTTETGRFMRSLESGPTDWDEAVSAAAARLSDASVLPETRDHASGFGIEEELAALLCAYGVFSEDIDRGRLA
jgi:hypothetical protein